ncbi:MAG: hypothetical protein U0Q10_01520 [Dermatophilaceae bacterium]
MTPSLTKARFRLVVALLALSVLVPAVLAAAQYPRYWVWIAPELTPMTWIQTVFLVLAASASALAAVVGRLRGWSRGARLVHWLLAAGMVYLALDDRFAVHERIRDRILAPRDIRIQGLSWLAPGDFQMLFVAIAGLIFLPFVLRALRADKTALVLFCLGALTAAIAIGMDTIDPATMPMTVERLEQTLEECLELVADALFLAALGVRVLGLIGELADSAPGSGPTRTVAEPTRASTPASPTSGPRYLDTPTTALDADPAGPSRSAETAESPDFAIAR